MKSRWLAPILTAAMWIFSLAVYSRLPQRIPSHWNLRGEVDGWSEKPWAALMMPAMATAALGLLWLVRRIDPRRANIERFRDEWMLLVNLIFLFFGVMHVAMLGNGLGWPVNMERVILASVGLMFVAIGNYLPRIRSNWFMGIRTPWTLDNERVWRATHRVGGRVFVAGGLVLLLSTLLPLPFRAWAFGVVVALGLVPVVYSYVAWRRDAAGKPL